MMTQSPLVRVEGVSFGYQVNQTTILPVLHDISLNVYPGEYLAIIGHNASGKSTLSKHLNGILTPQTGDVIVDGMNTKEKRLRRSIRQRIGMVFQHPDNQIVATIVEDDIAFGLENIGVSATEMRERIDYALEAVGMSSFRKRPPHHLSGGQKQRVAIAGIIAMMPECLVLDEATSMLDTYGRRDILAVVDSLHQKGMAIVTVTHHMSEVTRADRVIIMEQGRIVMEGTPREVFLQQQRLEALRLDVPAASKIAAQVNEEYEPFAADIISKNELIEEIGRLQLPRTGTEVRYT